MEIIRQIIDAIFPPRDSERLVRAMSSQSAKMLYHLEHIPEGVSLSPYKHPAIRALITENKFYRSEQAAKLLFELVFEWQKTQSETLIFVPVPLGTKRMRERGYNQVAEVLNYFSNEDTALVRHDLCSRPKETPPQLSLPRSERLLNVHGAFVGDSVALGALSNVTLVIVDDVSTTGATMRAVRAALAPHVNSSCKIICVALAH